MDASQSKPAARRTRVEPGIYTRPDGTHEIGFRDAAGKQRWRKVDGGIRAARAALAEAHAQRARGEKIAVDPRLTFPAAADAWWNARVVKQRATTQSAYRAGLKHLNKPENFGRSRMSDITATDVARFVSRQQAAGLKGWTIKGQLTVLSSVFSYASRHMGPNAQNPVSMLDSVERPSTDDERPKRILNPDELARLIAAVPENYRLLFELAAETGGRLGEILGLTWADIDLTECTVTFTHQLDRKGVRQQLTTKRSRRCLEVADQVAAKLREHKSSGGVLADHALVFRTPRTGKPLDHRNVAGRVLSRAVDAAGLAAVKDSSGVVVTYAPTFHSFRHSHASRLIAAGWDIEEVSSRLGHANVATTQRVYVHQFDAARRSDDRRSPERALLPARDRAQARGLNATALLTRAFAANLDRLLVIPCDIRGTNRRRTLDDRRSRLSGLKLVGEANPELRKEICNAHLMTWEETLSAIQALLGRRVTLWAQGADRSETYLPGGYGPISPVQVSGVLHRGQPNGLIEQVREAVPEALAGDEEVISFVLGDEGTEVDMTLTRSLFESAETFGDGDIGVVITQGAVKITVVDQAEMLEEAKRLGDS